MSDPTPQSPYERGFAEGFAEGFAVGYQEGLKCPADPIIEAREWLRQMGSISIWNSFVGGNSETSPTEFTGLPKLGDFTC